MATSSVPGAGICPTPFLQETLFPVDGGFLEGRFCFPEALLNNTFCCLPCPTTNWMYPDNFDTVTNAASWVNVGAMVLSMFLLLTYACLPVEKSYRHYLSICLTIATVLMQLGFVVPLGAKPDQCYNAITPNDMYSSLPCAFSGAFLMAGGFAGVMWSFLRSLSLHLQICWQILVGRTYMWIAMLVGWGVPAVILAIALVESGVSFRFGDTCHINHENSLADFWIPILLFSGLTVVLQFGTFGYCLKVYLASLADDSTTTNSSGLPSYQGSLRTVSPRQAWKKVKRVIDLQWRGIAIVLLIATDVIFFSIVFVYLDNSEQNVQNSATLAVPWLTCLAETAGDKYACLDLASSLTINEATTMAVLMLLSVNGIWIFIFLARSSMFVGWLDLFRSLFHRGPAPEFVSVDARLYGPNKEGHSSKTYEMLLTSTAKGGAAAAADVAAADDDDDDDVFKKRPETTTTFASLSPVTPPPPTSAGAGFARSSAGSGGRGSRGVGDGDRRTPEHFGREARYASPQRSFSAPRAPPPSQQQQQQYSQHHQHQQHQQPQQQQQQQQQGRLWESGIPQRPPMRGGVYGSQESNAYRGASSVYSDAPEYGEGAGAGAGGYGMNRI